LECRLDDHSKLCRDTIRKQDFALECVELGKLSMLNTDVRTRERDVMEILSFQSVYPKNCRDLGFINLNNHPYVIKSQVAVPEWLMGMTRRVFLTR
jgi:hypothetical protein